MISWKHSFEGLNEEYEITMKKKQALDSLLDSGKISESTYDMFNQRMAEAVADIQSRQTALLEKMNSKAEQLEQHVRTLEMLLANFEIRHVAGEIDQDVYEREINLFSTGLEDAKQEFNNVKDAISQLSDNLPATAIDTDTQQDTEPLTTEEVETPQTELENEQEAPQVVEIEAEAESLPEPPTGSAEDELDSDDSQEPTDDSQEPTDDSQEPTDDSQEPTDDAWDNPQQTWTSTEETYETAESVEETPPPEESSEEYDSPD